MAGGKACKLICLLEHRIVLEANGDLKKQRTILEKMKIGIPVEANLAIKMAGV